VIPKMHAPDLIRGGRRFFGWITHQMKKGPAGLGSYRGGAALTAVDGGRSFAAVVLSQCRGRSRRLVPAGRFAEISVREAESRAKVRRTIDVAHQRQIDERPARDDDAGEREVQDALRGPRRVRILASVTRPITLCPPWECDCCGRRQRRAAAGPPLPQA